MPTASSDDDQSPHAVRQRAEAHMALTLDQLAANRALKLANAWKFA